MGLFSKSSNKGGVAPAPVPMMPGATGSSGERIPTSVIASPPAALMAAAAEVQAPAAPVQNVERQMYLQRMKVRIHQQLVQRLDMQNLRTTPPETVRQEVRVIIRDLC